MNFALEVQVIRKDLREIDDLLVFSAQRLGILIQAGFDLPFDDKRLRDQLRIQCHRIERS